MLVKEYTSQLIRGTTDKTQTNHKFLTGAVTVMKVVIITVHIS